jgi:hypothetical protein
VGAVGVIVALLADDRSPDGVDVLLPAAQPVTVTKPKTAAPAASSRFLDFFTVAPFPARTDLISVPAKRTRYTASRMTPLRICNKWGSVPYAAFGRRKVHSSAFPPTRRKHIAEFHSERKFPAARSGQRGIRLNS